MYSVINCTSRELCKNKPTTDGGERRAHRGVRRPLFPQDYDQVFITGSTLYAGQEVKLPPPETTPLVITPFSAAVGHRMTEQGGYCFRKLTLTRTPES